ncbi:MAG: family 78 glycoside hydrolase catalytic domain, partial [Saccharofermentanales bacterium]
NGKIVSDQTLTPSYVNYDQCVEYQCFNITGLLSAGENALVIMLGAHWKQNPDGSDSDAYLDRYYIGSLTARMQIHIEYSDGTCDTIISDDSFKCCPSPVVYSSIYDGELYDARIYNKEVYMPGFDDSRFNGVKVFKYEKRDMVPEIIPPIRRITKIAPKSITYMPDNEIIVDFGVNMSGRIRIKVAGEKGRILVIRHAELINDDGSLNTANLRRAKATDTYICAGIGLEEYEPRFTYHGFRYACISNYPGKLTKENISMIAVRSSVNETGYFCCDDRMLNQIHKMMVRTMSNNLHSIPTDCCQRDERQGWLGDGQITVEALIANYDMQYFYRKWLKDIFDLQNRDTGNFEYFCAPGNMPGEGLSWTCAAYVILYDIYKSYDDLQSVELYFEKLKKYFTYLETREDRFGLLNLTGLDDWLGVEPTYEKHIRDAIYYQFAFVMSELSSALLRKNDYEFFLRKSKQIKKAYNKNYYYNHWTVDETGYFGSCYSLGQLNNALPLAFDMVPDKSVNNVISKFVWELTVARGDTQLTTGLVGTKYLFDALMKTRRNDIAYALFKRTKYPSWGFMIGHGATTVWERWQYMTGNEMNSHNHPPLCAPDSWFYRILGGIKDSGYDEETNRVFKISPWIEGPVKSVDCSQNTPWGTVSVKWKKIDRKVDIEIILPVNTRGLLDIPNICGQKSLINGANKISVDLG